MDRGAHAPSRVPIGALADWIPTFLRKYLRFKDVAGGGAGHDTRGRVCSPACFAPCLGEDLGLARWLAIFPQRGYIVFDSGRAEDRFRPSRPGEESPNTRGRDAA
jgi:hypothetical protein